MLKYCETEIVFREFPDEITLAINIANCPHRCVGCHSPHLQTDCGDTLDYKTIDKLIEPVKNSITCVGLMGGDSEPESVSDIANYIKRSYPGIKVGVYSGNYELPGEDTLSAIDYIKIGPYIDCLGPLDSETTNQRLYKVTDGKLKELKVTKSPAN